MTNAERRHYLAWARQEAVDYAEIAVDPGGGLGYEEQLRAIAAAHMFANVAQALKVGDPAADGVEEATRDPGGGPG